jgi:AcrR family transcriptional regulator
MRSDSRTEILKASLDLLEEGGVEALSMREVARRAGLSHQAPYHHFGDREAILAELARDGFEKLKDYFLRSTKKPEDYKHRIERMGRTYVQFALDHPEQFRLMFRAPVVDVEDHEDAKEAAESAFDMLVAAVTADQPERRDQEIHAIIACWSVAHGLATLLLDGKIDHIFSMDAKSRAKMVDGVFELFAEKISAR